MKFTEWLKLSELAIKKPTPKVIRGKDTGKDIFIKRKEVKNENIEKMFCSYCGNETYSNLTDINCPDCGGYGQTFGDHGNHPCYHCGTNGKVKGVYCQHCKSDVEPLTKNQHDQMMQDYENEKKNNRFPYDENTEFEKDITGQSANFASNDLVYFTDKRGKNKAKILKRYYDNGWVYNIQLIDGPNSGVTLHVGSESLSPFMTNYPRF